MDIPFFDLVIVESSFSDLHEINFIDSLFHILKIIKSRGLLILQLRQYKFLELFIQRTKKNLVQLQTNFKNNEYVYYYDGNQTFSIISDEYLSNIINSHAFIRQNVLATTLSLNTILIEKI